MKFLYKENLSFVSHCHVKFPYKKPVSLFGGFVQKLVGLCFSDLFVQNTSQQPDASGSITSDSQLLCKVFRKHGFISASKNKRYRVSKDYCITHHDDEMCFLHNCRYPIILVGNVKELLQKLDAFCFTYQSVDCLYTFVKHRFSGNIVVKSGKQFQQRAVFTNQRNKRVDILHRKRDF